MSEPKKSIKKTAILLIVVVEVLYVFALLFLLSAQNIGAGVYFIVIAMMIGTPFAIVNRLRRERDIPREMNYSGTPLNQPYTPLIKEEFFYGDGAFRYGEPNGLGGYTSGGKNYSPTGMGGYKSK